MKITTAFVLGAGLGTRLKSLTAHRPKPLIPVANRALMTYAFDHLIEAGIERFVVNTHWRAEAYAREFPTGSYREARIDFRHESPQVLETAGGIKNVEDLLGTEPFIVYNGDIFTDLPLQAAFDAHCASGNEVTMVLRSKDGPLQVSCDPASGLITDINRRLNPDSLAQFLFTGIYLVNPAFLARIPAREKVSVIPIFLDMIRSGAKLGGVVIDAGQWWDLGDREQYLAVHGEIGGAKPWIASSAMIAERVELEGATAIGLGAHIGAGARLRDCIVWDGATIAADSVLERCIVTAGASVQGRHFDVDL